MHSHAIVTEINPPHIRVQTLVCAECAHCMATCAIRGKPFLVTNKRNLAIQKDAVVRIGISPLTQALHGVLSLFIPVLCAIAGYMLAPELAKKIGLESTEVFKAVCVLLSLVASTGIVFAASRSSLHFTKPEIMQVL